MLLSRGKISRVATGPRGLAPSAPSVLPPAAISDAAPPLAAYTKDPFAASQMFLFPLMSSQSWTFDSNASPSAASYWWKVRNSGCMVGLLGKSIDGIFEVFGVYEGEEWNMADTFIRSELKEDFAR